MAKLAGSGTCVVPSSPAFVNGVWPISPGVEQGLVIGTFGALQSYPMIYDPSLIPLMPRLNGAAPVRLASIAKT